MEDHERASVTFEGSGGEAKPRITRLAGDMHDGRPVKARARKAPAHFAYLAAESATRPRDEIIELLRPRSDEARGRAALRSALSSLHKALEESTEPPGKAHLLADDISLGLAFSHDLELELHILEVAHTLTRSNPRRLRLQRWEDRPRRSKNEGSIAHDARPSSI